MRYLLLETTVNSKAILDSAEPLEAGPTKVRTGRVVSDGWWREGTVEVVVLKRRVDGNFVSTAALSYQLSSIHLTH